MTETESDGAEQFLEAWRVARKSQEKGHCLDGCPNMPMVYVTWTGMMETQETEMCRTCAHHFEQITKGAVSEGRMTVTYAPVDGK